MRAAHASGIPEQGYDQVGQLDGGMKSETLDIVTPGWRDMRAVGVKRSLDGQPGVASEGGPPAQAVGGDSAKRPGGLRATYCDITPEVEHCVWFITLVREPINE